MCPSLGYIPRFEHWCASLIIFSHDLNSVHHSGWELTTFPFLEKTPEESDECASPLPERAFSPLLGGNNPSFLLLFSVLGTYERATFSLCAIPLTHRGQGRPFSANSETGGYPGFGLSGRECPTVKRVVGRREDPTGFKPKTVRK